MCALVSPIPVVLPARRRVGGRTWRGGRRQLHLALGAGVCAYAPQPNKRCRPYLKPVNKSYRIDQTYIKVKGEDKYLYRALDSTGQTIDFLLTARRDMDAAKRFLCSEIDASRNAMPRVMNVDKN